MHEVIRIVAVPETQGVTDLVPGNILGSGTADGFTKRLTAELN